MESRIFWLIFRWMIILSSEMNFAGKSNRNYLTRRGDGVYIEGSERFFFSSGLRFVFKFR